MKVTSGWLIGLNLATPIHQVKNPRNKIKISDRVRVTLTPRSLSARRQAVDHFWTGSAPWGRRSLLDRFCTLTSAGLVSENRWAVDRFWTGSAPKTLECPTRAAERHLLCADPRGPSQGKRGQEQVPHSSAHQRNSKCPHQRKAAVDFPLP